MRFLQKLVLACSIGCVVLLAGIYFNSNPSHTKLPTLHFLQQKAKNRKPIEIDFKNKRPIVLLILGQSNAGNYGEKPLVSTTKKIYNFFDGKLYKAQEPLLGSTGNGSSTWIRLAEKWVAYDSTAPIIICPIVVGKTPISAWSTGECAHLIQRTLSQLKSKQLAPTHILWIQGEEDAFLQTSKKVYKQELKKIHNLFRKNQISAPFFVSITSYNPDANRQNQNQISTAQREFISENQFVYQGVWNDSYNRSPLRYDQIHFSSELLDTLSNRWFKILNNY